MDKPEIETHTDGSRSVEIAVPDLRQLRGVLHITAGGEDWTPSVEEMEHLASMFSEAITDGKGVVVTREGVAVRFLAEAEDPSL